MIYKVGKNRFIVHMENNTIVNNIRIHCVSRTHNCKSTFAPPCVTRHLDSFSKMPQSLFFFFKLIDFKREGKEEKVKH